MVDGGEKDEKIIAVPIEDPRFDHVKEMKDINPHTLKEIEHFFLTYKQLQNKTVEINGTEGREEAEAAFLEGVKLYKDKFPEGNK
jgi:inorganic pyrophosphatase